MGRAQKICFFSGNIPKFFLVFSINNPCSILSFTIIKACQYLNKTTFESNCELSHRKLMSKTNQTKPGIFNNQSHLNSTAEASTTFWIIVELQFDLVWLKGYWLCDRQTIQWSGIAKVTTDPRHWVSKFVEFLKPINELQLLEPVVNCRTENWIAMHCIPTCCKPGFFQ